MPFRDKNRRITSQSQALEDWHSEAKPAASTSSAQKSGAQKSGTQQQATPGIQKGYGQDAGYFKMGDKKIRVKRDSQPQSQHQNFLGPAQGYGIPAQGSGVQDMMPFFMNAARHVIGRQDERHRHDMAEQTAQRKATTAFNERKLDLRKKKLRQTGEEERFSRQMQLFEWLGGDDGPSGAFLESLAESDRTPEEALAMWQTFEPELQGRGAASPEVTGGVLQNLAELSGLDIDINKIMGDVSQDPPAMQALSEALGGFQENIFTQEEEAHLRGEGGAPQSHGGQEGSHWGKPEGWRKTPAGRAARGVGRTIQRTGEGLWNIAEAPTEFLRWLGGERPALDSTYKQWQEEEERR